MLFAPASASFRIPMIFSSVNRFRFIAGPPRGHPSRADSHAAWNSFRGAGRNHSRGRAVCSNTLLVDMHLADDAVLRAVTRDVLDPEVVGEALDLAVRELEQPATAAAARQDAVKAG